MSASSEGELEARAPPTGPVLKGSWRLVRLALASSEGELEASSGRGRQF